MASAASMLQCSLTGGSLSSVAICLFVISCASVTDLPLSHSVAKDDDAIAEPQPNVLNLDSVMTPLTLQEMQQT